MEPRPPTETLTFLFTDIEGSTNLLRRSGAAYPRILEEHRAIIRAALSADDGVEVDTEGDSFFAVFATPGAALRAAVAMQRELEDHDWPGDARVRVRMGLHTGEAMPVGGGYVGLDVHRASRIADAGHGGQIILSEATQALVRRSLPEGVRVVDLGQHRLRDLPQPERLFQVSAGGLPAEFPELRSLDARPNNLPALLSTFVGREDVIREIEEALEETRLLTLTGPGGTGKTRVALEVAHRRLPSFRDGAWFVDLSTVMDPAVVPAEIAIALRATRDPGATALECVTDHLRDLELLLVLDNFEQVLEATPAVEQLLARAPKLKVMVTSRSVLSVYGEREYPVPPLQVPEPSAAEGLSRTESVALFVDRARAVLPRFELTPENEAAVGAICSRLDGLPLAIELAAGRVNVLTPQAMLPRLDERFALLSSGPRSMPERQRTLRGAIDWSYRLLEEAERKMFARLAVFSGGGALEAIEAVCDRDLGADVLDVLGSLVNDSLLRRTETHPGEVRFRMLETIREYAVERLAEEPDADEIRRRHGTYYLDLAVRAEPYLVRAEQKEWLDRCDHEHDNIRAALKWSVASGEVRKGQMAAWAMWRFWHQRGHLAEGRRKLEVLLEVGKDRTPERYRALTGAGGLAYWQNDYPATKRFYDEALEIAYELDDPRAIAEGLFNLSFLDRISGDEEEGMAKLRKVLEIARSIDDDQLATDSLWLLGRHDLDEGRLEEGHRKIEQALKAYRKSGNLFAMADSLSGLGAYYRTMGDIEAAAAHQRESMRIFVEVGNPTGIAMVLEEMAVIEANLGHHERALRLGGAASALRDETGGGAPAELMGSDEDLERARRSLGPEDAERAWAEGREMGADKAIAYALDDA